MVLLRRAVAERGEGESQHLGIAIAEGDLLREREVEGMPLCRQFFAIQDFQRSDIYGWHHVVGLDLIWPESVETAGASEIDASVACLQGRIRLELFTDESVVQGETLQLFGFVLHDTAFGGEPESSVILNDAHHVVAGNIERYAHKKVFLLVIKTESAHRTYPQASALIHRCTVHLVVWNRMLVFCVMPVNPELFVTCRISQQPAALSGKP